MSLKEGKILDANLFENVVSTMNLGPNVPPTRSVVRWEITMERIDPDEFESIDSSASSVERKSE